MGVSVRLDMGPLLKLKAEAKPKAAGIVKRTAYLIWARTQMAAPVGWPVDTGTLKNSMTTKQTGDMTWTVSAGAAYAGFVEFGTSRMAARPVLIPAVEGQRAAFVAAMRELFE